MAVRSTAHLLQKPSVLPTFQLLAPPADSSAGGGFAFEGTEHQFPDASTPSMLDNKTTNSSMSDPFDNNVRENYTHIGAMAYPCRERPQPKTVVVWYCDGCGHGPIGSWQPQCPICEHHRCSNCTLEETKA